MFVLIQAALAAGALGAKLTGAGRGGSVFALARPGHGEESQERELMLGIVLDVEW
ncbi:MAG: hypothetical protein ACE5I2_00160 [Anaerolineae bacterium]